MKKNMPPEKIKDLLMVRGVQSSGIARELGVTSAAIYQAIYGKSKSKRIHGYIAHNLGLTASHIWPELYGADVLKKKQGRPLSKGFIK